jgi:hypothetical protein
LFFSEEEDEAIRQHHLQQQQHQQQILGNIDDQVRNSKIFFQYIIKFVITHQVKIIKLTLLNISLNCQ